jgi:hypothetical protein
MTDDRNVNNIVSILDFVPLVTFVVHLSSPVLIGVALQKIPPVPCSDETKLELYSTNGEFSSGAIVRTTA